jgi:hypothetical protein
MYYNNSTFPIFLYPTQTNLFSVEKIYENLSFIGSQENFEHFFLENISTKKNQDLFGYLMVVLPSIIISKSRKFNRNEINSKSIIDQSVILELINLRIDLQSVDNKLNKIKNNEFVKKIEVDVIVSEILLFINQYVFIKLSRSIVSTQFNGTDLEFNFIKDNKIYSKYNSNDKPIKIDRVNAHNNFISGYKNSFDTVDEEIIKLMEIDLIFMSKPSNQKKRLKSIIEKNLIFSEKITNTKKNKLLIWFFKNVISKIFYKQLDENLITDFEVSEAFRLFQKRVVI